MHQSINYTCWEESRISQVINREAVEMDSATFLATHFPITDLRYERGDYDVTDDSEQGLLGELLNRARTDQHTFVVLKGIPGTGKSHLVRWLKERYVALCKEEGLAEETLLIRRANSSLRETLRQIIREGIFDSPQFSTYLQRLEQATNSLSGSELSNRLLNALQEAAMAVDEGTYEPSETVYSKRIVKDMPNFLLSSPARDYLQRSDGGIQRIVEFLSGEERQTGTGEEMPQFDEADFDFPPELLRQFERGDVAAKRLSNFATSQRASIVNYMNALLNRAVSNLTTITPEQLRAMFSDLRRQLRKEGKNLTLFIEDITAFTGLDTGLIDVLVAQHGSDNPEFCRLTSLIGVTDNYYAEQFRENIRQRVTFLISLNSGDSTAQVSNLLRSDQNVVELAGRYLNAIRLSRETILTWANQQANPDALPNACTDCPVRNRCHEHFGFITIEGEDNHVGLFPFNERALSNLYNNLNPQRATRTPRALLNNILSYILSSHTDKIRVGTFPPPPNDLAPDVDPPNLQKPSQRQSIERVAKSTGQRNQIETLLRIWGDGTVDSPANSDEQTVGALTPVVFEAFQLPFFIGDNIVARPPVEQPTYPKLPITSSVTSSAPQAHPLSSPSKPAKTGYSDDIEQWRTGGKLINYTELAKELVSFVKNAISWELHGVSRTLVDERITQRRFVIEDQSGRESKPPHMVFERSNEFALVLHAIDHLNLPDPTPEQLATDVTTLHQWLARNEQRLLDYVKSIGSDDNTGNDIAYEFALTQAVYGLTAISGKLSKQVPESLFHEIVAFAKHPGLHANGNLYRTVTWNKVVKRFLGDKRTPVLDEYLFMLNCPQGTSREVGFVDAARALNLLKNVNHFGELIKISFPETRSPAWKDVIDVHDWLVGEIGTQARQEEITDLIELQETLKRLLSDDSVGDVLKALRAFQRRAETLKHPMQEVPKFKTERLQKFVDGDIPAFENAHTLQQWRYLSAIIDDKSDASQFAEYLDKQTQSITDSIEKLQLQLASEEDGDINALKLQIDQAVRQIYTTIDTLITSDEE